MLWRTSVLDLWCRYNSDLWFCSLKILMWLEVRLTNLWLTCDQLVTNLILSQFWNDTSQIVGEVNLNDWKCHTISSNILQKSAETKCNVALFWFLEIMFAIDAHVHITSQIHLYQRTFPILQPRRYIRCKYGIDRSWNVEKIDVLLKIKHPGRCLGFAYEMGTSWL